MPKLRKGRGSISKRKRLVNSKLGTVGRIGIVGMLAAIQLSS